MTQGQHHVPSPASSEIPLMLQNLPLKLRHFVLVSSTLHSGLEPWREEMNSEAVLRGTVGGLMIHPFCRGFSLYIWAGPTICPHMPACLSNTPEALSYFPCVTLLCPCQTWEEKKKKKGKHNLLFWNLQKHCLTWLHLLNRQTPHCGGVGSTLYLTERTSLVWSLVITARARVTN